MRNIILRDGREIPVEVAEAPGGYRVLLDGVAYEVDSIEVAPGLYSLLVGGVSYEATVYRPDPDRCNVYLYDGMRSVEILHPASLLLRKGAGRAGGAGGTVKAPMPGRVVRVLVKAGDAVEKGSGLVVLEAMKMQNELQAPCAGTVKDVLVAEGDGVEGGAPLVTISQPEG